MGSRERGGSWCQSHLYAFNMVHQNRATERVGGAGGGGGGIGYYILQKFYEIKLVNAHMISCLRRKPKG